MIQQRERNFRGMGLVASGPRKIRDGKMFDKFFPDTKGTDPIVKRDGSTYETVDIIDNIVKGTLDDTKKIAAFLLSISKDWEDYLKKVFWFHYRHYQYNLDEEGKEQLRRPARSWKDRKKGIDCDCFTISVLSFLINGANFSKDKTIDKTFIARIVKMYKRDYYQHIYVTVPKFKGAKMTKRNEYWVIDPVLNMFNEEAPGITQIADKKIIMTTALNGIDIQYLNGTDNSLNLTGLGHLKLGEEFNGLGDGLGDTEENVGRIHKDFLRRNKLQLINTRNYIRKYPHMVKPIYEPKKLEGALNQLLAVYDNEGAREQMLEHLSGMEESYLQPHLQGLGNLIHSENDDDLSGLVNESLEGLGRAKRKAKAAKKTGFFTKQKNVNKAAKKAARKGKVKGFLKKVAKGVLQKYNPAFITIRAGMLAAMKTNVLRIASRVYWATQPKDVALKAGVTASFYDKATKGLDFLKKTFVKRLGGDEGKLLKAITTGRAAKIAKKLAGKGKLTGVEELAGLTGLGAVTAAAVGTAMTFLTTVAATLKKLMGKKGDDAKEESETGGETEATDPNGDAFVQSDAGSSTAPGDNSQSEFVRLKNQSGNSNNSSSSASVISDEESSSSADDEGEQATVKLAQKGRGGNADSNQSETAEVSETDSSTEVKPGMSATTKVVIGVAAAGILFAGSKMIGNKSKGVAGTSKNVAKKASSKKKKKVSKVSLT